MHSIRVTLRVCDMHHCLMAVVTSVKEPALMTQRMLLGPLNLINNKM